MSNWRLSTEIEPNYDGGLMRSKWLIGGIRNVKTLTQRNAIPYLYRFMNVTESTICFVENESRFYKLINNPVGTTVNGDWEAIELGAVSTFIPIGTWNTTNAAPALSDAGAAGANGSFYFVVDTPTPTNFTDPGLFQGNTVTVVNGDTIVSVGSYWVALSNATTWNSIAKPSVIDDYVAGTVIPHIHLTTDITDLGAYMLDFLRYTDVADHTVPFATVLDAEIVDVGLLRQHYYTKDDIDGLVGGGGGGITALTGGVTASGTGSVVATVVTNANSTGDVTSVGNATTYTGIVPSTKGGAGTVSGLLKANGSGVVSAAVAGTDYITSTDVNNIYPSTEYALYGEVGTSKPYISFGGTDYDTFKRKYQCWRKGSDHNSTPDADIILFATDYGSNTLSPIITVRATAGINYTNPNVFVGNSNRVFVTYLKLRAANAYELTGAGDTYFRYSDDIAGLTLANLASATWSVEARLTTDYGELLSTSATSVNLNTISGTFNMTVATGLIGVVVGRVVKFASASDPSNKWFTATVNSYVSGTGVMNVTFIQKLGITTHSDWLMALTSYIDGPGKAIHLGSGVLLKPVWITTGGVSIVMIYRSTDNGMAWTYLSTISVDGANPTTETSITKLSNGNIFAAIRTNTLGILRTSFSTDNGVTWSAVIDRPEIPSGGKSPIVGLPYGGLFGITRHSSNGRTIYFTSADYSTFKWDYADGRTNSYMYGEVLYDTTANKVIADWAVEAQNGTSYSGNTLIITKEFSFRAVTPPTVYDPDYQSVLDWANIERHALPSDALKQKHNQLVASLRAAGKLTQMDGYYLTIHNDLTLANFSLRNWRKAWIKATVTGGTFTINGWQFDGVDDYFDTRLQLNLQDNYLLNSAEITVYYPPNTFNFSGVSDGTFSTRAPYSGVLTNSGGVYFNINGNGLQSFSTVGNGLFEAKRLDGSNIQILKNGTSLLSVADAVNAIPSQTLISGAERYAAGTIFEYRAGTTGLIGVGGLKPSWQNEFSIYLGSILSTGVNSGDQPDAWKTAGTSTLTEATTIAQAGFDINFLNGNHLIGPTGAVITSNTRADIRGVSGGTVQRWGSSTNTLLGTFLDDGKFGVGSMTPTSKFHVGSIAGGNGGILIDLLAEGAASISYSGVDFRVPTSGLVGQLLSTANNYASAAPLLANSMALLAEATSGQLLLGSIGTSGIVDIITGGLADANKRISISSSGAISLLGATTTLGGGATASELRFLEPSGSGSSYVGFKAPALAGNIIFTLPPAFVAGGVPTDVAGDGVLTMVVPSVYTDEQAQDAIGAMVDASLTYVDGTPLLQRAALTGDVIATAGSNATTVVKINGTTMSALATGILKNTTGTGVPSIAINSDLPVMSATVGGAVPTPPNNTTTFLRGDGTFATPAGAGDMVLASAQTNSGLKTFLDASFGLRNVANTFNGSFVNTNTADRIYTLKDAAGTIAFVSDITGTNSGTNTGDQTITNSSDATSHTVTLSSSGGTVQLIEGANITLTTGGTGSAGTVTIASSGGGSSITDGASTLSVASTITGFSVPTFGTVLQIGRGYVRLTDTAVNSIFSGADGNGSSGIAYFKAGDITSGVGTSKAANTFFTGGNGSVSNFNGGDAIIRGGTGFGTGVNGDVRIANTTQKLTFFEGTPVVRQSAVTTSQGIADALTAYGLLPSSTISSLTYAQSKALIFKLR